MTLLGHVKDIGKELVGEGRAHQLRELTDGVETWARTLGTADGRASARTLTDFRNRFRGERAVIIGNGPSLRCTDLSLLNGETTFGLNRVYLAFDEIGFQTTFLVAINELLIGQIAEDLAGVSSQMFLRWSTRNLVRQRTSKVAFLQSRRTPGFTKDARRGVWEGATVTYVAMQLAFHMGFAKIVLVGVDHNFVTQGPAHEVVESSGPDLDHFHPDYFGPGFRWQLPDLPTSEYAYPLAKKAYEYDGRTIVDATVGGKLEIFTKLDLEVALAE